MTFLLSLGAKRYQVSEDGFDDQPDCVCVCARALLCAVKQLFHDL